jgi:hypothetical protein
MPLRHRLIACSLLLVGAAVIPCGCSSEPKDPFKEWSAAEKYSDYVPPTATSVASGTGPLSYKVPENGTLYLLDTSRMVDIKGVQKPTVLIAGYVPAGTEVMVDPEKQRVHARGRSGVRVTTMDPTHSHEMRFDPSQKKES